MRFPSVRPTSALFIALILSASAALAQPAPSLIRGRVLTEDDDRPLRRALVTLAGARPVLTDDEGRFEIPAPDSSSSVTVTKAGYASATATPPRRSPGANRELLVRLSRGGVISGRVIDSNGETAIGSRVVARFGGGTADEGAMFDAEADDLGEYRISGLPPGRYEVSLAVTGTRVLTAADYARLMKETAGLLPSVRDLLAQQMLGRPRTVDVRAGEETSSVDFEIEAMRTLRSLAPVMRRTPITVPPAPPGPSRPGTPASIVIGNPEPALNGGRVLSVFDGYAPRSLDILLSGGGAVSGAVVDSAGEPFQGIAVRALQVRREHGRTVTRAFGWQSMTDDRGRYRLFGLAPGSYLVVASLDAAEYTRGTEVTGFAPQYFPGTPHVGAAQPLLVEADIDLSGADFMFAATPVVRVSGKALDAIGQPLVGRVSLNFSQRSDAIATEPRFARTGPGGSFEFTDVAPGDYVIHAAADAGLGGPAEFGAEYVTVTERDAIPVVIATSRGATLEGRFVVEGMQDPPMRAYSLHAEPTDLDRSPPNGRGPEGLAIHDDGRFSMTGLHGPMRLTAPNTLPGWYVKSVTLGGVDVTDTTFDFGHEETIVTDAQVVLSNNAATIAGSIEGQSGLRIAPAFVTAFSTNRELWFTGTRHVRRTLSGQDGSFEVNSLPPGEYFVAAVDASTPLDLQASDTLESLVTRAARITAREGAVSEVTLRLIRR